MQEFDFQFRTRIVFGPNSLDRLGDLAKSFYAAKVLLVCDPGIRATPHARRAIESLTAIGIEVNVFSQFGPNPDSDMVDRAAQAAAEFQPDLLVGLGGGSSLDCCKGMNFVYSCGGTIHDYRGVGRATCDMLPMIAIPTTAGTGSETQSFAIISDAKSHIKMACGDGRAAAALAILDPALTLTCPNEVTSLTGIDAISHAIESYVCNRRTAISQTFSRRAFGLLARSFPKVLATPDDLDSRGQMLLGASFAGIAIEASMLGAAHATANPLTSNHGVIHGQAVGMMLPNVIRLNAKNCAEHYQELLREIGIESAVTQSALILADLVTQWVRQAGLKTHLSELDVDCSRIDDWVAEAMQQWTGNFNPVPLDPQIVRQLYASVAN
jgi:alcohol dehydrogenase